jgi:thiol-disulfide isomerase/thioredoxin
MKGLRIFVFIAAFLSISLPASSSYAAITWAGSLNSGLKEAKAKNKPVMVDFYTDWCGWCKKLDRDTYADPEVANLAKKFVCVKVNGDKYSDLVSKYGVSGYPTILFLDAGGEKLDGIVGYVNADGMVSKMNSVLAKHPAVEDKAEEQISERPAVKKNPGWKSKVNDWWGGVKKTDSPDKPAAAPEPPDGAAVEAPAAPAIETVYCDVLVLNSGRKIQGNIESETGEYYNIKLPLGKASIKKADVKEVKKLLPEEACVAIGDKYYESKNYDAAIGEYNKALSINPEYKPAKVSLESAKKKKFEAIEQAKLEQERKQEAAENIEPEPAPAEEQAVQPAAKRINFGFNVMNRELIKRKYDYKDFGFSVDDYMVVNGFYAKDCNSCKPVYPAQEAGLRPGDKVVVINGEAVGGLTAAEATRLIGSHRYTLFVVERP